MRKRAQIFVSMAATNDSLSVTSGSYQCISFKENCSRTLLRLHLLCFVFVVGKPCDTEESTQNMHNTKNTAEIIFCIIIIIIIIIII